MISRLIARIMRIPRSRGFGVQSPWAYRFLRYVIRESWPYYAYADLAGIPLWAGDADDRYPRLLLRLANHLQPTQWLACHSRASHYSAFITSGCRHCRVQTVSSATSLASPVQVASVGLQGDYASVCEWLVAHATVSTLLILEDIRRDQQSLSFWRQVKSDSRVGVSFDLYDYGLLFFDPAHHKRDYQVNL